MTVDGAHATFNNQGNTSNTGPSKETNMDSLGTTATEHKSKTNIDNTIDSRYSRPQDSNASQSGNKLTVIAGPSAVGKGTIVKQLQRRYPDVFVSVSVTTRPPRQEEEYGKHYFFISRSCFDDMRKNNDLLEWAEVHGQHYYATPRQPVLDALEAGKAALLEIDVAGAFQVKEAMPDAFMIFIEPPSWEELERRLIGRGSENAQQRNRRLQTAREEMALRQHFDACVINDNLDKAVNEVAVLMGLA